MTRFSAHIFTASGEVNTDKQHRRRFWKKWQRFSNLFYYFFPENGLDWFVSLFLSFLQAFIRLSIVV